MRVPLAEIMADIPDAIEPQMVAHNTVSFALSDGTRVWRHHHTNIVTRTPDGQFRLDSGGFRTRATKSRISKFSPAALEQREGVWYIGEVPFFDGIVVDQYGAPPDIPATALLRDAAKTKLLKRQIEELASHAAHMLRLPLPELHVDCWVCQARAEQSVGPSNPLLNVYVPNHDALAQYDRWHLESHLDKGELQGSLIVNALRWSGKSDPQIMALYGFAGNRAQVKSALRRYLHHKLGID